jgi:cell division GTPase FtsZ
MAELKNVKVGAVGIGLGGSNLATAINAKLGGNLGLINLSAQDLKADIVSTADKHTLLGSGKHHGAGKDRDVAKALFGAYMEDIKDRLVTTAQDTDILFVCFSGSGGTGSGLGPAALAISNFQEFKDAFTGKKAPIVFALVECPDFREGIRSLLNTIGCLSDLKKFHSETRVMLINNDVSKAEEPSTQYSEINEAVVGSIARYLEGFGSSRSGCLDLADRFTGMNMAGIHSFFSFEGSGKIQTPFILPEGARVQGVFAEIPEGTVGNLNTLIARNGIESDDRKAGYFTADDKLSPIVHLAGFVNYDKLTERFRNQYSLLKARATETQEVNLSTGLGLKDLKGEKEWAKNEYSTKTIGSADDIMTRLNAED